MSRRGGGRNCSQRMVGSGKGWGGGGGVGRQCRQREKEKGGRDVSTASACGITGRCGCSHARRGVGGRWRGVRGEERVGVCQTGERGSARGGEKNAERRTTPWEKRQHAASGRCLECSECGGVGGKLRRVFLTKGKRTLGDGGGERGVREWSGRVVAAVYVGGGKCARGRGSARGGRKRGTTTGKKAASAETRAFAVERRPKPRRYQEMRGGGPQNRCGCKQCAAVEAAGGCQSCQQWQPR